MKSFKDRIVATAILAFMTLVAFGAAFWGFSDQFEVMRKGEVVDAIVERVWSTNGGRRSARRMHIDVSYTYNGVRYTDEAATGLFPLLLRPDKGEIVRVTVLPEDPEEAWFASDVDDWIVFNLGSLAFALIGCVFAMFAVIIGSGKGKV